ncbi:MAG TPA: ATP phosphoribosyltransferase regulatory subunit, partial [Chthoniobacterales bacterium]|nr:ATP phosphoribosyltransferase regulatory subunit [Chthoniobacterales bacterium]
FLSEHQQPEDRLPEFLGIIDKLKRENEADSARKLQSFQLELEDVRKFLETPAAAVPGFEDLSRELRWRGLEKYVELDLKIVRGLDYYTGLVFEIFDRNKKSRALAGGGRYDDLISAISDGESDLPAAGFAIGDVTFTNLIVELEHTQKRILEALGTRRGAFFVIADETHRREAIGLAKTLRSSGIVADYSLREARVSRQFEQAEAGRFKYAIVIGQEWPQVRIKFLADRTEKILSQESLLKALAAD